MNITEVVMNTRDNQRGGIVAFAIIGILLAGLLAGGLYISKQQARIAQENTPPPIAIDTEKEANETEDTLGGPKKDESETSTPPPATTTPKPATGSTPSTPRVSVPVSGPSEPLPSTGPSDIFLSAFAAMAITFVSLLFVRSSARLRHSALSR